MTIAVYIKNRKFSNIVYNKEIAKTAVFNVNRMQQKIYLG